MSNLGSQRRIGGLTPAVLCWGNRDDPSAAWSEKGLFNLRGLPVSTLVWLPLVLLGASEQGPVGSRPSGLVRYLAMSWSCPSHLRAQPALSHGPLCSSLKLAKEELLTPQKVAQATDQASSPLKPVFDLPTMPSFRLCVIMGASYSFWASLSALVKVCGLFGYL